MLGIVFGGTFEDLEEKLKGIKTIKVVFIQKTVYSWYPRPDISKGYFYASRGGKFRIEYTYPDRVVLVSDGERIIVYNEEEKEAIVDSVERNTSPVIESLFFFSRPLSDVFEPVGEIQEGDRRVIIMRPKARDENIERVFVEVNPDLEVVRVKVIDRERTETVIEFIDVQKNFSPSPGLFTLDLPPDVRLREAGGL
ncbi:MAG: outer-membrane lipoprotein carrier protein LolA [Aquificota bacterium]|nr:outer-membrane lipoprotein carrier protein LolA [Aquificota bacterium]